MPMISKSELKSMKKYVDSLTPKQAFNMDAKANIESSRELSNSK